MPWTIDLKSLDGLSTPNTNVKFASARVTWAKDGDGSCEVNLTRAQGQSGLWLPGQRRVIVKNPAGTAKYGGWLSRLERSGAPGSESYRVASVGLASALQKRVVVGDFSRVSTVSTTIARDLVAHVAAQSNDQTKFTTGTNTGGASASLTRYFCDGDVVYDALNELANRESGGFQWEITPAGALDTWVGGRGTDMSATVDLGPDETQDWGFIADEGEFATYVMGLGDRNEDLPCGAPLTEVFDALRTTRGRIEVVATSDTTDESELIEIAEDELRARVASRYNLRASWIEGLAGSPWAFGTVWIGDVVKVHAGSEFGGDVNMRCISVSLTMEPGVREFVEMEFEAA